MYVCIYYDLVSKTFINEKIVMKCNVKNQMLNTCYFGKSQTTDLSPRGLWGYSKCFFSVSEGLYYSLHIFMLGNDNQLHHSHLYLLSISQNVYGDQKISVE